MAHPARRRATARGGPSTRAKVSEAFKSTPPLAEIHSASRAGATWDAEDRSFVGTGSRPQAESRTVAWERSLVDRRRGRNNCLATALPPRRPSVVRQIDSERPTRLEINPLECSRSITLKSNRLQARRFSNSKTDKSANTASSISIMSYLLSSILQSFSLTKPHSFPPERHGNTLWEVSVSSRLDGNEALKLKHRPCEGLSVTLASRRERRRSGRSPHSVAGDPRELA